MKIAVDMGHCPKSTGASGYLNELTEDRKIGKALISELKSRGHSVVNVTPGDSEAESLTGRARRANNAGCDFFCSIHLNAGGGTGTEVYTTSGSAAADEAKRISANVAKVLGIKDRGHKTARYTVLTATTMAACLVEVCFVDNKTDRDAYKKCTPEKIAKAIADGILGKSTSSSPSSGSASSSKPSKPSSNKKKIDEDGEWGRDTTTALQETLGMDIVDGIISGQSEGDLAKTNRGGLKMSSWKIGKGGSPTIEALQKKIGVKADKLWGVKSTRGLQEYLGTPVDGYVDDPSEVVKALQKALNNGTL